MKFFNTVATVLVATAVSTSAALAAVQAGGIEAGAIKGFASFTTADGTRVPLQTGGKIPLNVLLETEAGSTLELFLSNGAFIVLQPGTQVRVTSFTQDGNGGGVPQAGFAKISKEPTTSQLQVYVNRGSVVVDSTALNSLSRLEVRTSLVSAVTSNSIFSLNVSGLVALVNTLVGSVEVRQTAILSAGVTVPAGNSATFRVSSNEAGEAVVAAPVIGPLSSQEKGVIAQSLSSGGVPAPSGEPASPASSTPSGLTTDSFLVESPLIVPGIPPVVSPNGEGQNT